MNRLPLYLLLVSQSDPLLISSQEEIEPDQQELFAVLGDELNKIETSNSEGILYLREIDLYAYVVEVFADTQSKIHFVIPHTIVSSVALYFNIRFIKSLVLERFGDGSVHPNIFDQNELDVVKIRQELLELEDQIDPLMPDLIPNMLSPEFSSEAVNLLLRHFQPKLAEFFYALILEIPIICTNLDPMMQKSMKESLIALFSFLRVELDRFDYALGTSISLYQSDFDLEAADLGEYFVYDMQSDEFTTTIPPEVASCLQPPLEEAISYHLEGLIPFKGTVYQNVFWNIQKIYGALALSSDQVDFSDFLDSGNISFLELLNTLFLKMVYEPHRLHR